MTGWEKLKKDWTDQFVEVRTSIPELVRFEGIVGRVVTVNGNGLCLVDFQDGGWYDINPESLSRFADQEAAGKMYRSPKAAAVRHPVRQN